MTTNFIDMPNKKLVGVTKRSELEAAPANILTQLKSKDNQAAIVINKTTGEAFISRAGQMNSLSNTYSYTYDFAVQGGAVGAIELDGPPITAPCDIHNGYVKVTTTVTSGGSATLAFGTSASAATNLETATAIGTIGTVGKKALAVDGALANSITLSATGQPVMTVGTAALTAGKLELILTPVIRTEA